MKLWQKISLRDAVTAVEAHVHDVEDRNGGDESLVPSRPTNRQDQLDLSLSAACFPTPQLEDRTVEFICICEAVAALFHVSWTTGSPHNACSPVIETIKLAGNPLDITKSSGGLIVSLDHLHQPGSRTELKQKP
ncbi:hypothetical protein MRB53_036893 [Persea americana]|nr:hypothetical protein MRB53_036893 [Persea americana]